ncbi:MAG: hypothetical protein LBU17_10980 [Treponema sp.]|jgi:hypothetical protein|nr:hypothetical protein [Treponema sp.]
MKKLIALSIVFCVLVGGAFAQEEGLKFSGALKTGINFSATSEKSQTDDDGNPIAPDPVIKMYNDDADKDFGRFDLNATYTKDNYGVVLGIRAQKEAGLPLSLRNGYLWTELINNKLNIKVGKIDDSVWTGGGLQDFNISTGWGARFEVKPIDGLNVGLFLTGPDANGEAGIPTFTLANGQGFPSGVDFLLETAIGVQYESDAFAVSAGLKLDGQGDGKGTGIIESDDFHDPEGIIAKYTTDSFTGNVQDGGYDNKAGIGAYLGVNIKAVDKLTAIIEAAFSNLGAFGGKIEDGELSDKPVKRRTYYDAQGIGTIWINEHFAFQVIDPLGVGLKMHQYIFGGSSNDPKNQAALNPELTFAPYVEYTLNVPITLGLEAKIGVKPDYYALKLDIKPNLTYNIGGNAKLVAFYDLGIQKLTDKIEPDPANVITNTVQLDFIWTF